MSQRLIRKNTTPVGEAAGQALFLLRGATPDGDGNEGGTGSESGAAGGDGTDGSAGSEGQAGTGESGNTEDIEALRARMVAADRRAAAAEKARKELEDAALSETEKKDRELSELQTFRQEAEKTISSLQTKVAFLSANDVAWHNPEIALKEINLANVQDENGEVDKAALKREIARIAKEMPYLVKTGTGGDSGGGAGEKGKPPAGQSGGTPGSGNKNGDGKGLDPEELRRRYPALYV